MSLNTCHFLENVIFLNHEYANRPYITENSLVFVVTSYKSLKLKKVGEKEGGMS